MLRWTVLPNVLPNVFLKPDRVFSGRKIPDFRGFQSFVAEYPFLSAIISPSRSRIPIADVAEETVALVAPDDLPRRRREACWPSPVLTYACLGRHSQLLTGDASDQAMAA